MEQVVSAGSMRLLDFGVLGIFAGVFLTVLIYVMWHILKRFDKVIDKWDETIAYERAEHAECRKELHTKLDAVKNKLDILHIQGGERK